MFWAPRLKPYHPLMCQLGANETVFKSIGQNQSYEPKRITTLNFFSSTKIRLRPPAVKKIACTILDTIKESSPQATSCHKRTRARSERPPAGPEKYKKVLGNGHLEQNFAFSRFLSHAIFAPRTRPCAHHFPSSINFLGTMARTISFLDGLASR